MIRLVLFLTGLFLAAATPTRRADAVTVFAAASLGGALDEVAALWRDSHAGELRMSYAGSGALARQIIAGAPADVFISAAPEWMDAVEAAGLIGIAPPDGPHRVDLLGNALVLIAGPEARLAATQLPGEIDLSPDTHLAQLLGDGHLAMAFVTAVPAGQYGRAALDTLGLWDSVAPRVVQADNVRAALTLVARGEAALGIVYASDARAEPRVRVLARFAPHLHPTITYPAAVLAEAPDPVAARAFFDFLTSPQAQQVFVAHGFLPPLEAAP